jgi:hypothetical protein
MAKAIFQAQEGLSFSNRNEEGKYSVGDLIDPFRDWGYLKPALSGTTITVESVAGGTFKDIARYSSTISYAITATKLHQISSGVLNTASPWNVSGAGYAFTGIGNGISVVQYVAKVGGVLDTLTFYIGETKAGMYQTPTTFDDDWLNTIPASAAVFSHTGTGVEHPYTIWKNMLFIGDGRYVVRYDGQTGDNGTYTAQYFDVGWQWLVKGFFKHENYLGILVRGVYSPELSEIILIDGSSTTEAVRRIQINEKISSGVNLGNTLVFIAEDMSGKCWIKELGEKGLEPIIEIRIENATTIGTLDTFSAPTRFSEIDIYDGKIAFGCKTGTTSFVFVFGRKDGSSPYILSKPFSVSGQTITCVKWIDSGTLYVGSYTGTTYYLQKFTTTNATSAVLKFPFKDLGQKVKINYIKYYFKSTGTNNGLASSDNLTAGLDIDYGTTVTLGIGTGNISYTKDGAVTSKKFIVGTQCHAFRPTLTWTEGGTAISKICVDYSFISD